MDCEQLVDSDANTAFLSACQYKYGGFAKEPGETAGELLKTQPVGLRVQTFTVVISRSLSHVPVAGITITLSTDQSLAYAEVIGYLGVEPPIVGSTFEPENGKCRVGKETHPEPTEQCDIVRGITYTSCYQEGRTHDYQTLYYDYDLDNMLSLSAPPVLEAILHPAIMVTRN